ncbi:MAG: GNAT family N-acetyltransferase [Eubacterium sp.]|nr:GNAT family N-acetyltransferase [Eubacterium sp.]
MTENKKKSNPAALLPIAMFLLLYLGNGIYFQYINPEEGVMGFYVVSVVLAFSIALIVAFLQNRSLSFDEKIHVCAKGVGDDNIVIMLFIFILAGAFSGVAGAAGGAGSIANLLLSIIPGRFAVPGLFLIACLISMSMGTSVGTISVLAPIAVAVSANGGLSTALCVGVVVGGAMFGDNLSFISDTTIAATKTQGVEMKDKFRTNIRVAVPAAAITLVILIVYAIVTEGASVGDFDYNIWQALPYFLVLLLSILGINVFLVLFVGCALFTLVGFFTGSLTYSSALASMGSGIAGMFETMIVTILVASIASLMKENGGFEAILSLIRRKAGSKRGGMFGIAFLTMFMDVATANNTVAIVIAAPIAKDISREYGVEPRKVASLLDTCSCITQGIIPYGAQLLVAANLAGLASFSLIPFLIYPFILIVFVVISIIREKEGKMQLFDEIPRLEGKRVTLKRITSEDEAGLRELVESEAVYRYLPTFLYEKKYEDTSYVIEHLYDECLKDSLILGVYVNGEFAGLAEFYGYRDPIHKVSVGYRLLERFWGQGIATETLSLMIGYLYGQMSIEIITASTMVENQASAAVLRKNGFNLVSHAAEEDWGYDTPTVTDKWIR